MVTAMDMATSGRRIPSNRTSRCFNLADAVLVDADVAEAVRLLMVAGVGPLMVGPGELALGTKTAGVESGIEDGPPDWLCAEGAVVPKIEEGVGVTEGRSGGVGGVNLDDGEGGVWGGCGCTEIDSKVVMIWRLPWLRPPVANSPARIDNTALCSKSCSLFTRPSAIFCTSSLKARGE